MNREEGRALLVMLFGHIALRNNLNEKNVGTLLVGGFVAMTPQFVTLTPQILS